jgi:phosphohistidine phosphatase SixA
LLKSAGVHVHSVLHSGKLRSAESAEIIAPAVLLAGEAKSLAGINPTDPVQAFSKQIAHWSHDTLIVGHMPFLQSCVSFLFTGDETKVNMEFQPGAAAAMHCDISGSKWSLLWFLRPELLVPYD